MRTRERRRWTGGRVRTALRLVASAVLVVGAAFLGGLALGSTWESTVANEDYRVSTQLIARSQVEIPTNIGKAVFDTHTWGPGVEITVSALALPPVERASGSPFIDLGAELAEIKRIAREAAIHTLWKFGGGALGGGLAGVLVWRGLVGSRARSRPRGAAAVVGGGVLAGAVAVAGWGAGAMLTFDRDYGEHLQADGLLAIGLSSQQLLQELNARDQAYAGYVQSLATYISQLRQSASPAEATDVAVRVLMVSDIHGRNVYPQLRTVIESQGIDFVVDSGDLVQWGTGFELSSRPDLVAGIESLGVPYVFAKGNHDGPGTVAALEEISNVIILDGDPTKLKGLSLLGVPDPRLFLDGGPAEAEQPEEVEGIERDAAQQAVALLGELQRPIDIAVMHHPAGARELGELTGATVWESGHTHDPALEIGDGRIDITVGTTGAAGIRTFNSQDEDGEVVSTPQSFDILDFNSTCEPVSLTRFTYPNVLSDVGNAQVTYRTVRLQSDRDDTEEADTGQADSGQADTGQADTGEADAEPARICG